MRFVLSPLICIQFDVVCGTRRPSARGAADGLRVPKSQKDYLLLSGLLQWLYHPSFVALCVNIKVML